MLDDARPPVLLTQRRLIDRLPELKAVQAVCIDELSSCDGVRVQTQSGDAPLRPAGKVRLTYHRISITFCNFNAFLKLKLFPNGGQT